jgi:predicted nucleic acid-binding Zn ribbon protein
MKRDMKNRPGPVHIGDVIQGILKTRGLVANTRLTKIWDIWENAVGAGIASNATPAAFKGRLLIVHAESSAWIQQLHFLKKEMIFKINRAMGEEAVQDIKFKIGPIR